MIFLKASEIFTNVFFHSLKAQTLAHVSEAYK